MEGVDFISYMRYRYEEMLAYVRSIRSLREFDLNKVGLNEWRIDELGLEMR